MMETRIAPGFLVASPQLKDPNFDNSVIFMIEHIDDEGSLGLVINREAKLRLATVLCEMNLEVKQFDVDFDDHPPLLIGGPVSPERGWVIHTPDWTCPETRPVGEEICVTSSLDILKAVMAGTGPLKYRFCLGYAGWGPHQLVEEIKAGAWINVPFSADLVFDVPLNRIWAASLRRLGIDPTQLVAAIGDA
jgi:putative transcriptional regulator